MTTFPRSLDEGERAGFMLAAAAAACHAAGLSREDFITYATITYDSNAKNYSEEVLTQAILDTLDPKARESLVRRLKEDA